MSKIQWKCGTLLAPVPVALVSCGEEKANIITIAWTGIINSDPPKTYISVRPERFSYDILKNSGEFVINLVSSSMVYATDYCGLKTGRTVDKFKETKLTKEPANIVKCPMIAESPLSLECKITDILPLGSHHMMIADIVSVNIDSNLLDSAGKLHLDKANLISYNHGEYFELGKKLGSFGFSCKKKGKSVQRPNNKKIKQGNKHEGTKQDKYKDRGKS